MIVATNILSPKFSGMYFLLDDYLIFIKQLSQFKVVDMFNTFQFLLTYWSKKIKNAFLRDLRILETDHTNNLMTNWNFKSC